MNPARPGGPTRRELLAAGGALVVAFVLRPREIAAATDAKPATPELPGSLEKQPLLDGWIRIDADGKVTVFTGKAELGQGIKTALLQIAAEELGVKPARITVVTADTQRTADEGYTAGSHSMQDSGTAIRHAAAQARAILIVLAAPRLGVTPESLKVEDGVIRSGTGSVAYGELVSGQTLHVRATPDIALRDPASYTVIGQSIQRVDIPAKVRGAVAYVQDLRRPGMVHGRIVRPPSPGAALIALDSSAAEQMPGVLKVVRDGNFVAVIAQREYQAITASRTLARGARWQERETLPAQSDLYKTLQALPAKDIVILDRGAPAAPGARSLAATYLRPYQMHASIGPSCAMAQLVDGNYTVWTHSQGVFPLRRALAELLGQGEQQVRCIHVEGSGCYGHNGADDVAADAALLARALPGPPVRVQWMREDEHMWEPYGPPMASSVSATLDGGGSIASWRYEVWSSTHSTRPGAAGDLLAARHLAQPFKPSPPQPGTQPEGMGDRNSIPLYTLPNVRVVYHFLPDMPLRVSALRSLGAYMNVFSIESFMDELARSAGADPVEFRLKHMADRRAQEVIKLAAEKFGWNGYQRRAGRGRGFAFARYKNLAGYAAMACEVEVHRDTGEVRLLRVVAAVDSGEVVNPDGIHNQIEGGIVQSASWTLTEEVTFDRTRVTSRDWGGYPVLRFPQVPQRIDIFIIPRPGQPFLGTGEVAQGPTAAMIANAVADATGVRLRQLPFSRERVRAALA
ncbi:MAG TPA: molybdopterin cofactor-binding domain-containing protein [Ramlibacter sp.]|nr:molybdopterin cofactor-binding domain-containing protein [Ramlibacter sp.]